MLRSVYRPGTSRLRGVAGRIGVRFLSPLASKGLTKRRGASIEMWKQVQMVSLEQESQ